MRVVFLVVLLVAHGASARPAKDVTREFQAGVDAFRLGKYEQARKHLERAKQLDPKLPGPHRFLAAVAQAEGRFADCVAAARSAIELNPTSAEIADTRKLHDDCRRSAGRPTYSASLGDKAAIGISANVSGATVTIDRLVYGATPIEPRPITAGPHEVRLAKPGYRSMTVTVNALAGVVTDLEVEMEVDPETQGTPDGPAKVTPRETGVVLIDPTEDRVTVTDIWVDGAESKHRTLEREGFRLEMPVGTHVIMVKALDHDPWRRRVVVSAGTTTRLEASFVKTAARERIRTQGLWFVGAGAGFALAGGVAVYQTTRDDSSLWKGLAGTAFGLSAVTLGVGVWALVRGRRPDLTAAPPLAILPVERGVIATTGLDF